MVSQDPTRFDDRVKFENFIKTFIGDCIHAESTTVISSLVPCESRVRTNFEPRKMVLLVELGKVNHSLRKKEYG